MRGFHAPYVPGWDCHGLPIEFKVTQEMRKAGRHRQPTPPLSARPATPTPANTSTSSATNSSGWACSGIGTTPTSRLNKEYEAEELRLFADIVEQGIVYRGKKPVYWSIPCRTALAEAEVEYKDHVSQSVYVKFPLVGRPGRWW